LSFPTINATNAGKILKELDEFTQSNQQSKQHPNTFGNNSRAMHGDLIVGIGSTTMSTLN